MGRKPGGRLRDSDGDGWELERRTVPDTPRDKSEANENVRKAGQEEVSGRSVARTLYSATSYSEAEPCHSSGSPQHRQVRARLSASFPSGKVRYLIVVLEIQSICICEIFSPLGQDSLFSLLT